MNELDPELIYGSLKQKMKEYEELLVDTYKLLEKLSTIAIMNYPNRICACCGMTITNTSGHSQDCELDRIKTLIELRGIL